MIAGVKELWSVPAREKKEVLPHATTRTDLEDIMRSVVSKSEKDEYWLIPLL